MLWRIRVLVHSATCIKLTALDAPSQMSLKDLQISLSAMNQEGIQDFESCKFCRLSANIFFSFLFAAYLIRAI